MTKGCLKVKKKQKKTNTTQKTKTHLVLSIYVMTISVFKLYSLLSDLNVHGKVYSIQHYVIKLVSDLRQSLWFSLVTPVSTTNKTDRHDKHRRS